MSLSAVTSDMTCCINNASATGNRVMLKPLPTYPFRTHADSTGAAYLGR